MRRRRGFTLLEVVLSLAILLIVGGTLFQGQRNLLRRPQMDLPTIEWYLMLRELENPDHQFAWLDDASGLNLVDGQGRIFFMDYRKAGKLLKLHHKRGGEITLMSHVASFQLDHHSRLTIKTTQGEVYSARVLIPVIKGGPDETTVGNHATIDH